MQDQSNRVLQNSICSVAVLGIILLALLTGCKGREDQALDQAKSQAVTTNTPQQVQYVDSKGNTVTQTVQPPAQQGGQPLVTTNTAPPAAGVPVPPATNPVVTPLGPNTAPVTSAAGAPMPAPLTV